MNDPTSNTLTSPEQAILPDIRQSICHTSLAAGFILLNIQNPYKERLFESIIYLLIMSAMPVVAFISWTFFFKRLKMWKRFPVETRNRITRTPVALKNRAFSHLLMSLLSACLTALGYIGHLISPLHSHYNQFIEYIVLSFDALIGTIAIAVLSSTVRDFISYFRASRS